MRVRARTRAYTHVQEPRGANNKYEASVYYVLYSIIIYYVLYVYFVLCIPVPESDPNSYLTGTYQ